MSYLCRELMPTLNYVSMALNEAIDSDRTASSGSFAFLDTRPSRPTDGVLEEILHNLFEENPQWKNAVRQIEAQPTTMRHAGTSGPWRTKQKEMHNE